MIPTRVSLGVLRRAQGLWRGTLAGQLLYVPYAAVQFVTLQQFNLAARRHDLQVRCETSIPMRVVQATRLPKNPARPRYTLQVGAMHTVEASAGSGRNGVLLEPPGDAGGATDIVRLGRRRRHGRHLRVLPLRPAAHHPRSAGRAKGETWLVWHTDQSLAASPRDESRRFGTPACL